MTATPFRVLWSRIPFVAAPTTLRLIPLKPSMTWSQVLYPGERIEVRRGIAWITQSGDKTDYIVHAGESFTAQKRGRVVVQALQETLLCVTVEG